MTFAFSQVGHCSAQMRNTRMNMLDLHPDGSAYACLVYMQNHHKGLGMLCQT